jgi:hypothetical protein
VFYRTLFLLSLCSLSFAWSAEPNGHVDSPPAQPEKCLGAALGHTLVAPAIPSDITVSRFEQGYWQFLASGQTFLPQDDPSLMSKPSLRSDAGSSEICGSMCALHWVEIVRQIEKIPPPFASEPEELDAIAKLMGSRARDTRVAIRNGLAPGQLADVIQTMLAQSKIQDRAQVQEKDTVLAGAPITLSDFFSGDQNDALFLRVSGNSLKDSTALNHYVLKVGANPATGELMILDPFDPNHPVRAKVTDLSATGKGFQITFPPESHLSTYSLSIMGLAHSQFQFSKPTP